MTNPGQRGRLRVLHVIETFAPGGAEVLLAEALPRLHEHVDLRIRSLAPPDTLRQRFVDAGLDVDRYGDRETTDLSLVDLARRLRHELRERPADIVHSHLFKATVTARLARLTLPGGPHLINTLHSPDYSNPESTSRLRGLARWMVDWTSAVMANDVIVAVSNAVAADFRRHMGTFGVWGRIEVIHNALDVNAFAHACTQVDRTAARRRLGWTADEFAVLSIGRLTGSKDYDSLIESIGLLRSRGVNARAVVIGTGIERARLERVAGEHVRFHGHASREEIVEALVACDVYVQPSRWEAFGIAILEAMAAARPVVASAVDGILEVVEDGHTGSLVPPGDAAAIAGAIIGLIDRPELRNRWGERGRVRAATHFSVEQWVAKTAALYSRITTATL